MLQQGALVGRYRIESLLGSGGMGQVYRALDTQLRRHVALKVLREEHLARDASRAVPAVHRLMREARAAASLASPNVVQVFDIGEIDGVTFIVMELVEGKPLRAFVGDTAVTYPQRIAWLLDVARGLSAAHARGIVHRDVKPENVLVCSSGVAKVLDFGVVKRVDPPPDRVHADHAATLAPRSAVTEAGRMVGTPLYMAPEQLMGAPVDARCDQFAFGLMAYELLAGVHPWQQIGQERFLLDAICHRYPAPLMQVAPDVPPPVQALVWRAIAKEPERRFPSMDDIVATLEQSLATSQGARAIKPQAAPARLEAPTTAPSTRRESPATVASARPEAPATVASARYEATVRATVQATVPAIAPPPPRGMPAFEMLTPPPSPYAPPAVGAVPPSWPLAPQTAPPRRGSGQIVALTVGALFVIIAWAAVSAFLWNTGSSGAPAPAPHSAASSAPASASGPASSLPDRRRR